MTRYFYYFSRVLSVNSLPQIRILVQAAAHSHCSPCLTVTLTRLCWTSAFSGHPHLLQPSQVGVLAAVLLARLSLRASVCPRLNSHRGLPLPAGLHAGAQHLGVGSAVVRHLLAGSRPSRKTFLSEGLGGLFYLLKATCFYLL